MSETRELDMEDLYNQFTTEEHIKESFERRTVPTGSYTFQAEKKSRRVLGDNTPWPGREVGGLNGGLLKADGSKAGRFMFDLSYIPVRDTREGRLEKLDNMSQHWGQLVTALDAKQKSVAEVFDLALRYPVSVYLVEAFKTPEGW